MQRTTVGTVELIALIDTIEAYPATSIYPAADLARYGQHLDADGAIALNFACFLVRDGTVTLLVDTGYGPEHGGKLLEELAEARVERTAIDLVLFTHLHGDHTGWNFDRQTGDPLFPNARYLVPKADWDHYGANPNDSFDRDVRPLQQLARIDLIEGERNLSEALTAVPTPGHTPGHTSVAITSGGERGFILGDVVISAIDAEDPTIESVFDSDNAVAKETRVRTIEQLIADGSLVGASHLPAPGLGRFVRTTARQYWQSM